MALILVDTSVWIDFFKSGKSAESKKLANYLEHDQICTTPFIKAEILSGAKTEQEFDALKEKLSALPVLEQPENFWDTVAYFRFRLARKGFQASMIDLAIAVMAFHHNHRLLTLDKEFKNIASIVDFEFE